MLPPRCLTLGWVLVLVPALSFAQQPAPPSSAPGAPAGAPGAADAPSAAPPAGGGSASAAAGQSDPPKAPTIPATGYGYDDKPQPRAAGPRRSTRVRAAGPVATLPGFEMLADGGSRLFVQLSQNVPVEEKRAGGSVTYLLKGVHVTKHNNERPLVTVHFNTPVSRARLIPRGRDLLFVVDLRASVSPTWKIEAAKDTTAILAIDFPKGDYLPAQSGGDSGKPPSTQPEN